MPLAPGTALQNGHYVIDALLEAAPNGDLYWGTHVVAGMSVFIQVFPLTNPAEQPDLSSLMARLEGVAFSPRSPLPNPFQLFRGNDHTLCLAMGTTVGLPWSSARQHYSALSPKQALTTIRQVASSVQWLKAQGLTGLDLSPNRVWLTPDLQQLTLTGLPHAYLQSEDAIAIAPDTSVQALAKLLFSFLTGELLASHAEPAIDDLRTRLHQHRPNLSPVIIEAIEQGIRSPADAPAPTLDQWLRLLPDAGAPHYVQPPSQKITTSPPAPMALAASTSVVANRPSSQFRLMPALTGTALCAAIAGVALGTVWRLNAQSLPGAIQLEPQQTFPTQADWSGDTPTADFDQPYVPARNAPIRRTDWYETGTAEAFEVAPAVTPVMPSQESPSPAATDFDFDPGVPVEAEPAPETPNVPLDALPNTEPAPAPVAPLEIPEAAPAEGESSNVSNRDDALLQPALDADPKAVPAIDTASES